MIHCDAGSKLFSCSVLFRDKNLGLAKQVLASLYKKNIQRLTKTFLTLSVVDVVNRAKLSGVEQAEAYIVDMVSIM